MVNPAVMMKLVGDWKTFVGNHPKFPMFLKAVSDKKAIEENGIIEISITSADGEKYTTNVKLTASDMDIFNDIMQMAKQGK